MVGNYSHRAQDFGAAVAFFARKTFYFCDCGREYIRFIHAVKAVKDANRAFESHARIDVFSAQRFVCAVRPLVVLHENIVPYFKIFSAVAGGRTVGAAFFLARIPENFRIGAARSRITRNPPIVFLRQEKNLPVLQTAFAPYLCRLLVARRVGVSLENGNCKPVCVKPEILVRR